MKKIDSFSGKYFVFSNFYPIAVLYENNRYPSTEHAFQAAKTLDLELRIPFLAKATKKEELTATQAKLHGRRLPLRKNWERIKYNVMYDINLYKFTVYNFCRQRLLDTGNAELIEGNYWGDTEWGMCNGVGNNHLGKILMAIRKRLSRNTI